MKTPPSHSRIEQHFALNISCLILIISVDIWQKNSVCVVGTEGTNSSSSLEQKAVFALLKSLNFAFFISYI